MLKVKYENQTIAVIEKITNDNRRPGSLEEGYFIYYSPHPDFGWLCCRGEPTLEGAKRFVESWAPDTFYFEKE